MDTISFGDISSFSGPKYCAVAQAVRSAIANGKLSDGEKLPPVRELAWSLKITPGTVARAYTLLTDEGVLRAEVGRGTFVASPAKQVQNLRPHLNLNFPPDAGIVSLTGPRLPDMGQVDAVRRALRQVADRAETDLLDYPTANANNSARAAAARWLSSDLTGAVDPDRLVVTHGGQNGISLVMQCVLRGRRPVVLVEELSYPGFRRAAELLRAEVVPVPMDAYGIIPGELDQIAKSHSAQLLCTSPEVHSPTCLHTPLERRKEVAGVARSRGFDILEDDCFRPAAARLPSYRMLAPDQTWYVTSISKFLTPALRIGFAVAPLARQTELRRAVEYGYFGLAQPLTQLIDILMNSDEIFEIAAEVRREIGRYVRTAVNVLGRYDLTWNEDVPFFWLRLSEGWRGSALCQMAEAEGLKIRSAEDFAMRDAQVPHAVRIAINAHIPLSAFEDAMFRLRKLLDNPPENISV